MLEGEETPGGGGEGKTPEPKIEAKADPPPKKTAAEQLREPRQPEAPAGPKAHALGEDDEIPDNADLLQLSKKALSARLARSTKKELRDRFGTDDFEKIKGDLDELATLRAEKEETRRQQLSENQRLKEDASKERQRAEKAEKEAEDLRLGQVFSGYDREANDAFGDLVKPKHLKRAIRELKEHVLSLDEAELPEGASPAQRKKFFNTWVKDFLEENPEFGKDVAAGEAPPPKKAPLSTGRPAPHQSERGNPDLASKTPKPGQANSMNRQQYAAFKRSRGYA